MANMTLPDGLLDLMQRVDTPTVCNAIEVAQGKRGFDGYTKGSMFASDPTAPAIVGFARTAQIAGSIGPSHAFVHVRNLGEIVNIRGMQVAQGDLIHADQHGGLVVPPEVIPTLKDAIQKLLDTENIILEPARQPDFDLDKLMDAWAAFENSRT